MKFLNNLKTFKFSEFDIIKYFKNEETIIPFKSHLVAKNAKISKYPKMPEILSFNTTRKDDVKDLATVFAGVFDVNFLSTRYTKGHIKEFVGTLEEFSVTASKNHAENKSHTLLYFDNMSEFLNDLKQKENNELYQRFNKLCSDNPKNKITYLIDKDSAIHLETASRHTVEFSDENK